MPAFSPETLVKRYKVIKWCFVALGIVIGLLAGELSFVEPLLEGWGIFIVSIPLSLIAYTILHSISLEKEENKVE